MNVAKAALRPNGPLLCYPLLLPFVCWLSSRRIDHCSLSVGLIGLNILCVERRWHSTNPDHPRYLSFSHTFLSHRRSEQPPPILACITYWRLCDRDMRSIRNKWGWMESARLKQTWNGIFICKYDDKKLTVAVMRKFSSIVILYAMNNYFSDAQWQVIVVPLPSHSWFIVLGDFSTNKLIKSDRSWSQ